MSVLVQLSDGLGNQMFQYAAGYALAARLGTECRVNDAYYARPQEKPRIYQLDRFVGAPMRITAADLRKKFKLFKEEKEFAFDRRHLGFSGDVYLVGYFQSEKYFGNVPGEIRSLFGFKGAPNPENAEMAARIARTNAVSVHVRRGDYVTCPWASENFGTCSLDYYINAFRTLTQRLAKPVFFVFSDDPQWCKENIHPPADTVYVEHNHKGPASEDMRLMSLCRHHILANSSFSWWGAWLNPSPQKIVVAPKTWMAAPSVRILDLIPEAWLQL